MNQENKKISQSVVKYIDILIQLYSSFPKDIRTELRTLQNTLIYNNSSELVNLIDSMDQKLKIKKKNKINYDFNAHKYHFSLEFDKENQQNRANRNRVNTDESFSKEEQNSFQKFYRTNEVSSSSSLLTRKAEKPKQSPMSKDSQQCNIQRKLSSKGLLKIVKKNRIEKIPTSSRSSCNLNSKLFLEDIKVMLSEMIKNDPEIQNLAQEIDINEENRKIDYGQIRLNSYQETEAVSILE